MSPVLAGGFFTNEPPRKSLLLLFDLVFKSSVDCRVVFLGRYRTRQCWRGVETINS